MTIVNISVTRQNDLDVNRKSCFLNRVISYVLQQCNKTMAFESAAYIQM